MKSKNFTLFFFILFTLFLYGTLAIAGNFSEAPPEVVKHPYVHKVSPANAMKLIQQNKHNPKFVILDVRTPKEFFSGRIPGAINIDYEAPTFQQNIAQLDKSKTYLVYCRSGLRSGAATELMESMDFKNVFDLEGGILNWKKSGLPMIQGP